jgi:hypothetical protein
VVYQGQSISKFFIDKKLVVTGADGMMLLRMYLSPLAKDNDEEEIMQKETIVPGEDYSPNTDVPDWDEDEDDNEFTDEEWKALKIVDWDED